ncbi:diacylglycerol/lipid kinase family protein [Georgenia sp. MJ170]|uniref:diacylglycerol/lipid kinase family protein n=1 Tax=Georgenia sunbinii TaxID=3117728 RepID=UPI002F262159
MGWEMWIAVAALVVAIAGLVVGLLVWRALRRRTPSFANDEPAAARSEEPPGPPAVVFNPSKERDWDRIRELVAQVAGETGLPEPIWLETTVEDPGAGPAREAVARGASVVIAAGGDGTVRAVAEELAGGTVPMGLLPLGTGNLLARNLEIPLIGMRDMVTVAVTGRDRPMDLGWLRLERAEPAPGDEPAAGEAQTGSDDGAPAGSTAVVPPSPDDDAPGVRATQAGPPAEDTPAPPPVPTDSDEREHVFLVIGGMGFDAAMVGGADDELKAKIGWIAYFVGGVRHLVGRKIHATIVIGGSEESAAFHARTVLVANCGRLPGGVVLFPDAQLDDGWLDIAAIDTRGGLIGWVDLLGKVVLQGLGIRNDRLPYATGTMDFRRSQTVTVRTSQPEPVQVDGDLLGDAVAVHARVQPGGLLVRTP